MALTPKTKNSVHWAPSPFSDSSSQTSSSFTSSSTIQYLNAQLISHGFALSPGLSLDGLSTADAESVTKCLLSMLSQRVEDMTRAEELTTKLRTLSYDHERLRTMHSAATETAEGAEREAAAARAKLTIANRAQTQAEAVHKQTTGDLQRARTALQTLRATHVAEIKKREKEVEAMRERWSKLADAQLRVASLPSGMVFLRLAANASVLSDGGGAGAGQKGVVEGALEEAEKAGALLREENKELKGLVVDAANAVRKILHKTVSSDPDDLEFPPPLATIDLFPLGARDVAFARLSALLTSLQDMLTALRASSEVPTTAGATTASGSKPQILFADLAKKAAESDAKAHKWEIEELRNTIAGLRDELKKVKAEKKLAPTSRLQDISPAQDNLASYLPPNDEVKAGPALEPQHEMEVTNPEPSSKQEQEQLEQHSSKMKREMPLSTCPEKRAPPTTAQPGPSRRSSPRKTRSKSKPKVVLKSPLKAVRTSKASSASAKRSSSRPRRLSSKRVEASFETEVIPSILPPSLLPTSFVLPPPSPESRLPPPLRPSSPHPTSFLVGLPPPVPPLLFPTTTPPFPPPVQHSTPFPPPLSAITTARETREMLVPGIHAAAAAAAAGAVGFESQIQNGHYLPPQSPPQTLNPFPLAKPLVRNMSHAYSPVKPSPLSRILMLAASPESATAAAAEPHPTDVLVLPPPVLLGSDPNPHFPPNSNAFMSGTTTAPAPVFERPQLSAPAPLRTDTTSNTAGTGPKRRRKRTSLEADLDLDADSNARPSPKNNSDAGGRGVVGMDVVDSDTATAAATATTKDPRAPEKENTIRRRLRGPAAVRKANNVNANGNANVNVGRGGMKTRKMAAAAASAAATTKSESGKSGSALASVPGSAPAPAPAATTMMAVEAGRVGGAASRLLAAAHGSGGPRRIPVDSLEAAAGVPGRRVS